MKNAFEIIGAWFAANKPYAELMHIDKVNIDDDKIGYHVAYVEPAKNKSDVLIEAVCAIKPVKDSTEYAVKVIDDLHICFGGTEVDLKDVDILAFTNAGCGKKTSASGMCECSVKK